MHPIITNSLANARIEELRRAAARHNIVDAPRRPRLVAGYFRHAGEADQRPVRRPHLRARGA
jgi:hypothetical protein